MPIFKTRHGFVDVDDWGYRLQGRDGGPLSATGLAEAVHDLIVMDYSWNGLNSGTFSRSQIARIQDGPGGEAVVAAYLSIGEASGFRSYWNDGWTKLPSGWTEADGPKASYALTNTAPDWLGPVNPDWPESRKVRYWDRDWQSIIFNDKKTGWLDKIVAQGFDAAYLDIVDAYYFWGEEVRPADREAGDPTNSSDAAKRMINFIVALTEHARETNPNFFVIQQNGEFIIDDLGQGYAGLKARYYDAVGAIAVEDTYFIGDKDENNPFRPDTEKVGVLTADYLNKGVPVFAVDYLNQRDKIEKFFDEAIADGFIPYAAPTRDLDRMGSPFGSLTHPTIGSDSLYASAFGGDVNGLDGDDTLVGRTAADDTLKGAGGEDVLRGRGGDDLLLGGTDRDYLTGGGGDDDLRGDWARDTLTGGGGDDVLFGGDQNDRLIGNAGYDHLVGGGGSDQLWGGAGRDTLAGNSDNDRLAGGGDNDRLFGDWGRDTLIGGDGDDVLTGGGARDVFVVAPWAEHDRITDFTDGVDVIDLRAFDFVSVAAVKSHIRMVSGDAVFSLRGTTMTIDDTQRGDLGAGDFLI